MKKIAILIILITSSISQQINAQIIKEIGIKTGASVSKQNWTYKSINVEQDKDYRTGLNVALNLEWFNSDYVTLLSEIGYIQKGTKEKIMSSSVGDPATPLSKTFETRFDYLYFSPQLKIRKDFNKLTPYVFVGPRIDYYLSSKSDFDLSVVEKQFKEIMYGLNYGVGIAYRIKQISLGLEFANFYDFTDVMNTQPTQNNTGLKIKNNAFTINLGINYYFKNKDNNHLGRSKVD